MASVQDILSSKSSKVLTTRRDATVLEAINKMNDHGVGALVVCEGPQVVGMFTERDVLRRVVGEERQPSSVTVGEVMTEEVICCQPDMDLDEVSAIMSQKKIRHLPICDEDGKVHGMISIGDVNAHHASDQEAQIHFLSEYIYGRV